MFRPFSYCHVPSNLGNRQLEQGRINVIALLAPCFGKSIFFFIIQIAVLCWDPSYEHLVVLSLFLISANKRWDVALPPENFSLKHSRIVAKMNGLFGNVIMTVVNKHTCSSPVVIKLEAFCVAVDVVVDRFNFF